MRELTLFRRTVRREARKAVGAHPGSPSVRRSDALIAGREADYHNWPVNIDNLSPVQDTSTGAFFFMVGRSSVGGADPVTG
jgi:hypothetical protein